MILLLIMKIIISMEFQCQKILRLKQIEDNSGKTLVSEGVEGSYTDIINYAVFCLIRTDEENAKNGD